MNLRFLNLQATSLVSSVSLFFLLSCSSVQRNVSGTAMPTMPYEYVAETRLALNKGTDSKVTQYLNSLSLNQRIELEKKDPRLLTQAYYYCDQSKIAAPQKFRENDVYFSNLLKIKNPFNYLEDQYDKDVKTFVETENTYTYQSLGCSQGYAEVLAGLLKHYSKVTYAKNNLKTLYELSTEYTITPSSNTKFTMYEGLAHKEYSRGEVDANGDFVFTSHNNELAEDNNSAISNKATRDNKFDNPHFFYVKEINIVGLIEPIPEVHATAAVNYSIYVLKRPVRDDNYKNLIDDVTEQVEKKEVKSYQPHLVATDAILKIEESNELVLGYLEDELIKITKISYDKKINHLTSANLINLKSTQPVSQMVTIPDGKIAILSKDVNNNYIHIFDNKNKLEFSKKISSADVYLAVDGDLLYIYVAKNGVTEGYTYFHKKLLQLNTSSNKETENIKTETQFYKAAENKNLPYFVHYLKQDKNPQFILLNFYGGFFSDQNLSLEVHEKYLLKQRALVVKAPLPGDKNLGYPNWANARVAGKVSVVDDVILIAERLQKKYPSLKSKIFIQGWSNGGRTALLAALKRPELFAGVVAGSPNTDLVESFRLSNNDWSAEYGNFDRLDILQKGSPYHTALMTKQKLPPIFLRTAYDDLNVNPSNSFKMLAALRNNHAGGPFYLMTRPFGAGHGNKDTQSIIEEYSYIYNFIFTVLSNLPQAP